LIFVCFLVWWLHLSQKEPSSNRFTAAKKNVGERVGSEKNPFQLDRLTVKLRSGKFSHAKSLHETKTGWKFTCPTVPKGSKINGPAVPFSPPVHKVFRQCWRGSSTLGGQGSR
jgi:hypothetical protein